MKITFAVCIIVIITWGIYFIVIGSVRMISKKVTKSLKESLK